MFGWAIAFLIVAALAGAVPLVHAQGKAESELPQLVEELEGLLERGRQERLADPWFLEDLREVLAKYGDPWRKTLFHDEFGGGGTTPGQPWEVVTGEFQVDWRHGLRSVVQPPAGQPARPEKGEPSGETEDSDAARAIIGALSEALGSRRESSAGPAVSAQEPARALALAGVPITNAFDLRVDLTARPVETEGAESLQLGVYQGREQLAGYRLVYTPDAKATLSLVSVSPRGGTSIVDLHEKPLDLMDGEPHGLRWTRDRDGNMSVRLDEQELLSVTDRAFADPFDGLLVLNEGGDYALRQVTIEGTE